MEDKGLSVGETLGFGRVVEGAGGKVIGGKKPLRKIERRDGDRRVSLRIDSSGSDGFASVVFADRQSAGVRRVGDDDEHQPGSPTSPVIPELQALGVALASTFPLPIFHRATFKRSPNLHTDII